jgi:hypothetical protein
MTDWLGGSRTVAVLRRAVVPATMLPPELARRRSHRSSVATAPLRSMTDGIEAAEQTAFSLFAENPQIRQVANGFAITAGPVEHDGALLFTDVVRNRIVRYRRLPEGPEVTTFRVPSGYPIEAPP